MSNGTEALGSVIWFRGKLAQYMRAWLMGKPDANCCGVSVPLAVGGWGVEDHRDDNPVLGSWELEGGFTRQGRRFVRLLVGEDAYGLVGSDGGRSEGGFPGLEEEDA